MTATLINWVSSTVILFLILDEKDSISGSSSKNKYDEELDDEVADDIDAYIQKQSNIGGILELLNNFTADDSPSKYSRFSSKTRMTYHAFLEHVAEKFEKMKEIDLDFEDRKKLLVKNDYCFTSNEWIEILKSTDEEKLYKISNKRMNESLLHGIPNHLRGTIWIFLCRAIIHKEKAVDGMDFLSYLFL